MEYYDGMNYLALSENRICDQDAKCMPRAAPVFGTMVCNDCHGIV